MTQVILQLIGEDGVPTDELRESAGMNLRSLANRISEMKLDGLVTTRYELTEAGKRLLRQQT